MDVKYFAHRTADVSPLATIGEGTKIWQQCQVREGAVIGCNCILSKDVYIDSHVQIGNNVKIQNGVSIYHGVTLEDGVFCGPHCTFTNDRQPRAINSDGSLKSVSDWVVSETLIKTGASIGAHATIICGTTIGQWAMIGAGAVVTRSVPDYALVYGNPGRIHGFVCPCGEKLHESVLKIMDNALDVELTCSKCSTHVAIPRSIFYAMKELIEVPT